jgi:hypothetical protein
MYCPGEEFNLTALTIANGSASLVINSTDYKTNVNTSDNNTNGTKVVVAESGFNMGFLGFIIPIGAIILIWILVVIICVCCCQKKKEETKFSNIEENKDTGRQDEY